LIKEEIIYYVVYNSLNVAIIIYRFTLLGIFMPYVKNISWNTLLFIRMKLKLL